MAGDAVAPNRSARCSTKYLDLVPSRAQKQIQLRPLPHRSRLNWHSPYALHAPVQDYNFAHSPQLHMTMHSSIRQLPRAIRSARVSRANALNFAKSRPFSSVHARLYSAPSLEDPPKGQAPQTPARGPPQPPEAEKDNLTHGNEAPTYLGTTKRNPEFSLSDKVVLVSGAARGLGLTQAEALLEAGATGKSWRFSC